MRDRQDCQGQASLWEFLWAPLGAWVMLIILFLLAGSVSPLQSGERSQATSETVSYLHLVYDIDRSAVPPLYYRALTLRITIGPAEGVNVRATAPDGTVVPASYTYDAAAGTLLVTTDAARLELLVEAPQDPAGAGAFAKTALKGDARWAWSHSFDDNMEYYPATEQFRAKGYRAMLYFIGNLIDDSRDEDWIVDKPGIRRFLADGWSVGNHTWDHECKTEKIEASTIISGYNRLAEIVATSAVPAYALLGFAAPCFNGVYRLLVADLIAEGTTATRFNESGESSLLAVDPGSKVTEIEGRRVTAFTDTVPIGRHPVFAGSERLAEGLATFDWMAAQAAPDRHFWYNTFSHGGKEAEAEILLNYLFDNYGAGGSDEAWVAPSDEIYSYLLMRDYSTVTVTSIPLAPHRAPVDLARVGDEVHLSWPNVVAEEGWVELLRLPEPYGPATGGSVWAYSSRN